MVEPLHPNIPVELTSFIGRERETAEVADLLARSRLVTLTGMPGSGKTRLAMRVAATVSSHYDAGVLWVSLAQLMEPGLVAHAVATALRLPEQRDLPVLETLTKSLQGKRLLLVLDNCEHLLVGCISLVEALLMDTQVAVLATSREALTLAGERRYPVPTLTLPAGERLTDDFVQSEAVRLFVDRARALSPNFALTPANASAVASICQQLEGIPLAIELASARVNVLSPDQIAARLDDRFSLLSRPAGASGGQHRSLRAALDWSYHLLSSSERDLFLRLSVFPASCTLDAIAAICPEGCTGNGALLDLVSSLVNKSLVAAQTVGVSEARYRLPETIRQYAREKLFEAGIADETMDRLLRYVVDLAEATQPKLSGAHQRLWLNWLEGEYDNIRGALSWSQESGQMEAGLRIGIAIYLFWTIRDHAEEGLGWMERLLNRSETARGAISQAILANSLAYAAFLAGFRGKTANQMAYGQRAAEIAEAAGAQGKQALAWALAAQGYGARAMGDYETELRLGKRVIHLHRDMGNRLQLGLVLSVTSFAAMAVGDYASAHEMLDEALPLLREAGNPYRIAMALNFSGDLARCEGNYIRAREVYEESMRLLRDLDAPRDLASVLHNLGYCCLRFAELDRAEAFFAEALSIQLAHGNSPGVAECLNGYAALAVLRDLPRAAARLLAAASAGRSGQSAAPAWAATRREYERWLAFVRSRLNKADFEAEQAAGRALDLGAAVEYARHLPTKATVKQAARDGFHELTAREREVVDLIAHGKTNGEIADGLSLSKRTIESHIAHILSKLGFTNRAQIVRWALEDAATKP